MDGIELNAKPSCGLVILNFGVNGGGLHPRRHPNSFQNIGLTTDFTYTAPLACVAVFNYRGNSISLP